MILTALTQYYERLLADPEVNVPKFGYSFEMMTHCIVLGTDGEVLDVIDLRRQEGKRLLPRKECVPKPPRERSGKKAPAFFLWDKSKYILGCEANSKGEMQFFDYPFDDFGEFNLNLLGDVDDAGGKALCAFIKNRKLGEVPEWATEDILKGRFLVFRLDGEARFIHERESLRQRWNSHLEASTPQVNGQCLVTGEKNVGISKTHPQLKNIGPNTAGASIVSFNFDAVKSFCKKQSFNAPVSERAAFAYTTALNHLLAPDSPRKVQVGDTTVVFWTEGKSGASKLFGYSMGAKRAEDEDLARRLGNHLSDIAKGRFPEELGDRSTPFYVLGLSPNAARISVRFWHVGTVGEMVDNLGNYFSAQELDHDYEFTKYPAIRSMI